MCTTVGAPNRVASLIRFHRSSPTRLGPQLCSASSPQPIRFRRAVGTSTSITAPTSASRPTDRASHAETCHLPEPRESRFSGGSAQGVNATPHVKQARLTCRKEVSLKRGKYRPRHGSYTEAEIAELWARRAAGETGTRIARHMGLDATALRDYFHKAGGIRPRPRKRSRTALSLADREEISRGLAAANSLRSIAARMARSPSTVSREVARPSSSPGVNVDGPSRPN